LEEKTMFKRKPLSLAVATAFGVASVGMLTTSVYAQDQDQDEELLVEEVVVTGSRIKRSMNTQSQTIVTFTAEDMQVSGDVSVSDALRSSTMNSIGSFREASGSSAQSNATINLRGVGSARTLVLVNGRRTVGSPSLGGGGTVNLNLIPFSAVDRIEVVADGASAVYGSDAVAGVINVILKQNYDGMTIQARYGDRDEDDGTEESASVMVGASNDRANVTFSLEYDKRDPIFDKDREYTAASKGDYDGDGFITGYEETVGISYYGYTLVNPLYDGSPFDPNNPNSWQIHPGANCEENDIGFQGPMKADAVFGPDTGFYCGYGYALVSANRAGLERINTYVNAQYELTDTVDLYADVIIGQNESFGRYAPPAAPGPTIPGDPRNNIGATFGYFRWTDIGFRDNVVNDSFTNITLGAEGAFGGNITWEAYYTYSDIVSSSVGNYYLNYAGLEYNISYDIQDFDQFVANIKHTTLNDDRQNLQKVFGGMQFDMFELGGGTASAYVAAEYFKIDYNALVDAQSEAGLVGGSAGNSAAGYRDVTAFSAEAIFPVTDWLEFDAAVRYDDYSDFGSALSPRVGAIAGIPGSDAWRFKASWGQGFRAPDLSTLYGATAFSAEFAVDYWGCQLTGVPESDCPTRQFDTYIGSNPNLDAEESESWSLGVEWAFAERWLAQLNWSNLDIESPINYTSTQDQLDVDYQTQGGNPNVTRSSSGAVVEVAAGYQNGTTSFNYQSLDMGLNGAFDTVAGLWGLQTMWTYYINYDSEVSYGTGELYNAVGTLGLPEWRGNMLFTWNLNDFFASVNWDYIGDMTSNISDEKWESWSVFNAQAGYNFGKFGEVTLGVNNIANEPPVLDDLGQPVQQDDPYLYTQVGRVYFVRYRVEM
jgi:iron complex outermembrane receptor protein